MAETWVINETITSLPITETQFNTNFISNNTNFSLCILNRDYDEEGEPAEAIVYGDIVVWVNYNVFEREGNWTNEAYRTITFETAPTGDLLTWLQANAIKQQSNITLDLSTLGLPEGTHVIQFKLSDDGATKCDSELSNGVSYVVSSWEYPVEDGDNLIITQANTITEDGDYLIIE